MLYFRFLAGAGSVLVALLLAANAWLPQPAATSAPQDFDHPTIRIAATRKGPERVVIDTSLPTLAPPAARATVADVAPPPAAAREAFAQLPAAPSERMPPDARPPTQEARVSPRKSAHRHLAARRSPEPLPLQPRRVAGMFAPWWIR
jgi:hypothetical protein